MTAAIKILAIVGRPNVGKSTLFNRIVGRPLAITHKEPGVTRDRVSAVARWQGKTFEVVDTGGIAFLEEESARDPIAAAMIRQAEIAMEQASVIVMVTDVTEGVTPLDRDLARRLRAWGKPVLVAVNKVDSARRETAVGEFAELGFDPVFPIAAAHGTGVGALLEAATADFPTEPESESPPALRLAVVGKPNAGKSSLINAILQSERTIVSEIPGTTRDAVDVPFTWEGRQYVLVDTAGLRHRRKIRSSVEQFSLMRAERSIRECDVAVLVLDAAAGVTKQDKRIGGLIAEARCSCVILVNKWDLAAGVRPSEPAGRAARTRPPRSFQDEYLAAVRRELFFLDWAPVVFASAKTGERVTDLFTHVARIEQSRQMRVETPRLNQLLGRALEAYPPPLVGGRRFKIYYAFQKPGAPPTFVLFVNRTDALTPGYERYLVGQLRRAWEFFGCPVVLECRSRPRHPDKKP
ncbi:MAG: ribosome biogenesis GTPase Der [Verrucomicrobiae bacterium]|nr:ribosome biogenesis GTPase Der [Verrucomicrobiae bacterium]